MKKIIALILSCIMLLTGCLSSSPDSTTTTATEETTLSAVSESTTAVMEDTDVQENTELEDYIPEPDFVSPSDPELLNYVEDVVYSEVIKQLDSEEYLVEGVHAVYMPEEYFEEVEFNSKENVYFGYTASELENVFQGNKYVFTMGDDGQTQVREMQTVPDDTYCQIMKNVATGSGVILVCATISVVTETALLPVSAILVVAANTAIAEASAWTVASGTIAGITKGIQTGNVKSALRTASLEASNGFKWGAVAGSIAGGASEAFAIKVMIENGLTMDEAVQIQRITHYPPEVIKEISSVDEAKIYANAKLKPVTINDRTVLMDPNIDLNFVDDLGKTNLERMRIGDPPVDPTGTSYEVHHVRQKNDGILAILKKEIHSKNSKILNVKSPNEPSEIDRKAFKTFKKAMWKEMANILTAA